MPYFDTYARQSRLLLFLPTPMLEQKSKTGMDDDSIFQAIALRITIESPVLHFSDSVGTNCIHRSWHTRRRIYTQCLLSTLLFSSPLSLTTSSFFANHKMPNPHISQQFKPQRSPRPTMSPRASQPPLPGLPARYQSRFTENCEGPFTNIGLQPVSTGRPPRQASEAQRQELEVRGGDGEPGALTCLCQMLFCYFCCRPCFSRD